MVGLISEDGSMSDLDLRDYALTTVQQVLARVPGVGEVEGFGGEYAMRVWLNPDKLTGYGLTVDDVTQAIQGLQRGGLRRSVRRGAGGRRPASQCLHHRP